MTDEEIMEQVKTVEEQLRQLKSALKENKRAKRLIVPKEVQRKYALPDWNGSGYPLNHFIRYPDLQTISKGVRMALYLPVLDAMDEDQYQKYSECMDKILGILAEYPRK